MIGYLLLRALGNAVNNQERVVAILTRVVVARDDPAFSKPTKFVGPVMDEATARAAAMKQGWSIARDGHQWRRVVPSPYPQEVIETPVVRALIEQGRLVICSGGGGIPVARRADGWLEGIEAVVDKDLASAVLAEGLGARRLVFLTDVQGVAVDIHEKPTRWIGRIAPGDLMQNGSPSGMDWPEGGGSRALRHPNRRYGRDRKAGGCEGAVSLSAGTIVRQGVR
jgi:carbamate kinase